MAITDIKWPDQFEGMQLLPGPFFLKGGKVYSYFVSGNSWNIYITGDVLNFNLADYLISTPSAGYNYETDWITIFTFANGYKFQCKFLSGARDEYISRWLDENGSNVSTTVFDGMSKGGGTAVFGETGANLGYAVVKVALLTSFPTNPGDPAAGPLPDTPASGVYVRMFFGSNTGDKPLTIGPGSVYKQCMTWKPYDEVHAEWQHDIFALTDVSAANTYFATHGNPIPSDYPQFVEDGLPNDYDPSRPGGGDGNYSDNSDPIDFPGLPTGGALACGAIHAFHVDVTDITNVFAKLWNTSIFDMATWQKLVSSPLDCIISLHCLPVAPVDGGDRAIWFGNFNTGESAKIITSQYVTVDAGYIDLIKFFGSAMDFSPYTKVSIYLPFSGIHDLATEDVQGSRIHVKYNIDVLTGDCVINVKCGQSVLYKFVGNMKMQIPVTSRDDTALGNTIKGSVGMIAGAILGGAVGSAPGAIAGATLSAAASVAAHKVTVSRSGELTGNTGILDEFVPYLIIHRPQQSLAVNYNKFKGYPSNLTLTLGSCTGYTEVEHIHLTGITGATDTELEMIENQLKEGVII